MFIPLIVSIVTKHGGAGPFDGNVPLDAQGLHCTLNEPPRDRQDRPQAGQQGKAQVGQRF